MELELGQVWKRKNGEDKIYIHLFASKLDCEIIDTTYEMQVITAVFDEKLYPMIGCWNFYSSDKELEKNYEFFLSREKVLELINNKKD